MLSTTNQPTVTTRRHRWGRAVVAVALAVAATMSLGQSSASAQGSCYLIGGAPGSSPAPNHEMRCDGGWTAWLGGGNTRFMGALNSYKFNVLMAVYTGGGRSGSVRHVCVAQGHTLWEDSSVAAAGLVIITANFKYATGGSAAPCSNPEV